MSPTTSPTNPREVAVTALTHALSTRELRVADEVQGQVYPTQVHYGLDDATRLIQITNTSLPALDTSPRYHVVPQEGNTLLAIQLEHYIIASLAHGARDSNLIQCLNSEFLFNSTRNMISSSLATNVTFYDAKHAFNAWLYAYPLAQLLAGSFFPDARQEGISAAYAALPSTFPELTHYISEAQGIPAPSRERLDTLILVANSTLTDFWLDVYHAVGTINRIDPNRALLTLTALQDSTLYLEVPNDALDTVSKLISPFLIQAVHQNFHSINPGITLSTSDRSSLYYRNLLQLP